MGTYHNLARSRGGIKNEERAVRLVFLCDKILKSFSEERTTSKRWIVSILLVAILVATVIPFQVAFMIVFIAQLSACSSRPNSASVRPSSPVTSSSPTPESWRREETRQSSNF